MGNIGDSISETIPSVGTSGTTYASNINLFLTEVKNRLEAKVPKASLANGALDMNGSPVQNTSYVGVSNGGGAPTTPSNTIQAYGGNMYWINTGGAVQITSGTTLNTSIVGGITGDYGGANPAQFRFVDADQEYYAYDDFAGGAWARLWAKNFDIAAGTTSSNRVRLAYGGGGSYTMTMPPAAPGTSAILQMDTSGNVTANNTLGITLSAVNYKISGLQERVFNATAIWDVNASHTRTVGQKWTLGNSTNPLILPLDFNVGDRITGYTVYSYKGSDATNTLTVRLEKYLAADPGTQTNLASATNSANAPGAITLSPTSFTQTITTGETYLIRIFQSDSTPSAADHIYSVSVSWDRP